MTISTKRGRDEGNQKQSYAEHGTYLVHASRCGPPNSRDARLRHAVGSVAAPVTAVPSSAGRSAAAVLEAAAADGGRGFCRVERGNVGGWGGG